MTKRIIKYLFLMLFALPLSSIAQNNINVQMSADLPEDAFQLVYNNKAAMILTDNSDAQVVSIAANALASDIEMVSDCKPELIFKPTPKSDFLIIAGTIGHSVFIDKLIKNKKLNVNAIKNKWESYTITIIKKPMRGVKQALVIAGSDRRGTAYGLFEISRLAGVSPWVWWADVMPEKHKTLWVSTGSITSAEPSVKYRGIFLNDEDWGLQPWAAKNWDKDIKDIGPKTYAKIFELLLRLRANFIWPAMHDCTKAFYYYPENPVVADKYAIVVGSSHCEPMLRNNVFEWKENYESEYKEKPGDWRYDKNKHQIFQYWDDRVKTSHNFESVYTVGMRGIHDSGIPGPKDKAGKMALMDTVLHDQQGIFKKYFGSESNTAQLFCPYKEVLDLYQSGIKLPDYVTLVWPDDNHGYIRQLSTPEEQKRIGGCGVYYHLSYWGAPHDYLWLSTFSPSLIAYEMTKAYQFGAKNLWVLNVGDIKPSEMETQFFLDMAWDINKWTPENASDYTEYWAEKTFGKSFSTEIATIKNEYYKLAQNGKPEHLRMLYFNEIAKQERLTVYSNLVIKVDNMKLQIPKRLQSAFFELIEYPVKSAALMNQKIFFAEKSMEFVKRNDKTALDYSKKSLEAFEQIKTLTKFFNTSLENGKWNSMMSYTPRDLPVFKEPVVATPEMLVDTSKITQTVFGKYIDNIEGTFIEPVPNTKTYSVLASNYNTKHEVNSERIITIDGLGLGAKSISRYPFTGKSFTPNELENAPYVEYTVQLEVGNYEISFKCLPTHAIHAGRGLSMVLKINNQNSQLLNVDNPKEDRLWQSNVLRGFSEAKMPLKTEKSGEINIRVYLLDTGLALSRIDINPK